MNARVVFTLAAILLAGPTFAQSQGRLNLPEFAALADKASETVTVTLDSNLLGMAARFLSNEDPDQAKAKKLVSSLTGIYVQHYYVRNRLRLSQERHRSRAPAAERPGLEPHRRSAAARRKTPTSMCSCSSMAARRRGSPSSPVSRASSPSSISSATSISNSCTIWKETSACPSSISRPSTKAGAGKAEVVRASERQRNKQTPRSKAPRRSAGRCGSSSMNE